MMYIDYTAHAVGCLYSEYIILFIGVFLRADGGRRVKFAQNSQQMCQFPSDDRQYRIRQLRILQLAYSGVNFDSN
jgi:hypothetical protein